MASTIFRLCRYMAWFFSAVVLLGVAAWWMARPTTPDAFYRPPADRPSSPGAVLRQEAFDHPGVPPNARAWRVLYTTTQASGAPAVASAIVMVSRNAAHSARPVIAWTHGTTGIDPGCAPSLLKDPFAHVPALQPLLDQGWIYVGTDYIGQGTPGPHPYLIGESEARAALDSIRALRQMKDIVASDATVVWGHSQGGHAALWAGIIAPAYAPDVMLLGVAAIAPASDLRPLIDAVHSTPIGRIMSSYVLHSYAAAYPDVSTEAYVPQLKRWLVADMASRCLAGPEALFSVAEALLARGSVFGIPPTSGPLGERLAQNTPMHFVQQPLFVAQGLQDDLVHADMQARFIRARCEARQVLEYRTYAGRDHLSIVAPDSALTHDLIRWTRNRFDNVAFSTTCPSHEAKQLSGASGFAHHH